MEKPTDFLPNQRGLIQALREDEIMQAGPGCFELMLAKDVKIGDLCYVTFCISDEEEQVNWSYLGQVFDTTDKTIGFHFADAHLLTGMEEEERYVELSVTDERNIYVIRRRPDDFPPPMLEENMLELCKVPEADGLGLYPEIEDRAELEGGEFVIVTTDLELQFQQHGDHPKAQWALPATAVRNEETGVLTVEVCSDLDIWSQGWTRPPPIVITPEVKLRYVKTSDRKLADALGDIPSLLNDCNAKLQAANKGYKERMVIKTGETRVPNKERWDYLYQTMLHMMQLTPKKWHAMRPTDPEKASKDEQEKFGPFFTQATNVLYSVGVQPPVIGNAPTNIKYITLMMDMVVAADGQETKEAQEAAKATVPDPGYKIIMQAMEAHAKEQKAEMAKVRDMITILTQQLALRDTTRPGVENWNPRIAEIIGDHDCAFNAMMVLADKAKNPGSEIRVSPAQARKARQIMLWEGKKLWVAEPVQFQTTFEEDSYDAFETRHLKPPNTKNWGGRPEMNMFIRHFEGLEFRMIVVPKDGSKPYVVKVKAPGMATKKVGFIIFVNNNHCDLGTVKVTMGEVQADGVNRLIFSPTEADRAESLLVAHVSEDRKESPIEKILLAHDVEKDPEKAKADFFRETAKRMAGQADGDAEWSTIEKEDRKHRLEKKKEKEKKEKEEKEKKENEEKEKKTREEQAKQQQLIAQQAQQAQAFQTQQAQAFQAQQARMLQAQQTQAQQAQQAQAMQAQQAQAMRAQEAQALQAQQAQAMRAQQAQALLPQQPAFQQPAWPPASSSYSQALTGFGPGQHMQPTHSHGQQPAAGGEFDLLLSGAPVCPGIVVFTKEPEDRVESMVRMVVPAAAQLVKAYAKRGNGTPGERCELHCLQTDVPTLQAVIQVLRTNGVRADVYKQAPPRRQNGGGIGGQAAVGMDAAILKAGVCRHYYYKQPCSRATCKFKCYGSQLPQFPLPPC